MKAQGFLQHHPVAAFFGLLIAWSFLYWKLLFTLLPLDPDQGPTLLHILLAALGASPSLFGILLACLTQGKGGLLSLASRVACWQVGLSWYAAALLLAPGINAAAYLLYGIFSGKNYPLSFAALAYSIPAGILASLLEEFGWRGFALPELQKRYSALVSSLILGLGWGVWHLPLFTLMYGRHGSLAIPLLILVAPVSLTAISVLMAWIHNNAKTSMLLMLLFHLSLTSSNFIFGPPPSYSGLELLRFHLISTAVQWSVLAVIVIVAGRNLLVRGNRQEAAV